MKIRHAGVYKIMGSFGKYLRRTQTGYLHWCPGCDEAHHISTDCKNHCGAQWSFNGSAESPTFSPSINMPGICHYFIKGGMIQFLSDSRHKLSGQTVPLPVFGEHQDPDVDALTWMMNKDKSDG